MEITGNQWPCQLRNQDWNSGFFASVLLGQYLLSGFYLFHGEKEMLL